jgi:hypothetical protein
MSVTIHNNDSKEAIHAAIRKVADRKSKKDISLDKYFGKVLIGTEGTACQKMVRNQW